VHYVYKITNKVNGKVYLGQTNDHVQRWAQHRSAALNEPTQVVARAMKKYGIDSFTFEVVGSCRTLKEVNDFEPQFIEQYNSCDPKFGYNVEKGGGGMPRSPETCKKMSEGIRKYYETHNSKRKGQKLTEEHKKNVSIGSMGKAGTNIGKEFSEEWKNKISQSQLGAERVKTRRFSLGEEIEICRLYSEENTTAYSLGKTFNVRPTLIRDILIRNNITIRKSSYNTHGVVSRKYTDQQELDMCADFIKKISLITISEKHNCPKTTLRGILIRHGVFPGKKA
jgi:group I intron endonuclease